MGEMYMRIENKLREAFNPEILIVTDESALHAGHGGAPAGGESHFAVEIQAKAFANKSRIETHRMINTVLSEELKDKVHALRIKAQSI